MSQGHSVMIITGSLAKDPEMRYTPSGQAVANFSIPVNRKYTSSNGEQVQETTWHRITVWGKTAEACNTYLKKGSVVTVVGTLTPDKSTGGPRVYQKSDGSYGASFEVRASEVRFHSSPAGVAPDDQDASAGADDDVPF